MAFPIFTCFLIFIIWFTIKRKSADLKDEAVQKRFWDQEDEANSTRRQDISQLPYLRLSLEELPLGLCPEDATLTRCEQDIQALADKKILNLSGQTNTALKLKYGAPNLPLLTEYDNNFTELVCLLQEWGSRLYDLGYRKEAEHVLYTAVAFGSDIKGTYTLLATIYLENKNQAGFTQLKQYAKLLRSLQKEPILKALDARDIYRDAISIEEPLALAEEVPSEGPYDPSFVDSRLRDLPFDEPQDPHGAS